MPTSKTKKYSKKENTESGKLSAGEGQWASPGGTCAEAEGEPRLGSRRHGQASELVITLGGNVDCQPGV